MPELPVCKILAKNLALASKVCSQRKVIPFTDPAASDESLTGGKGSSLAVLTQMAVKNNHLVSNVCLSSEEAMG